MFQKPGKFPVSCFNSHPPIDENRKTPTFRNTKNYNTPPKRDTKNRKTLKERITLLKERILKRSNSRLRLAKTIRYRFGHLHQG